MKDLSFNARKQGAKNKRLLMLGEELKSIISDLLQKGKIKHPAVFDKHIIITKVDVANNLSNARVYVTLCDDLANPNKLENVKQVLVGLKQEAGFIKKLLGKILFLPIIPNLNFINDNNLAEINRMEELLDTIKHDTKSN